MYGKICKQHKHVNTVFETELGIIENQTSEHKKCPKDD